MSDEVPLAALFGALAVLLLLSAFFSGSETALMRANRYRLRHQARDGSRGAQAAERLLKRPDRLIGLILPAVWIGTLLLTIVVLIFSEAAPKTLAALHPEQVAVPAAIVYYPLLFVAYPVVWLVAMISNGVLWLLGVRGDKAGSHALSSEELRTIVYEAGTIISRKYRTMLIEDIFEVIRGSEHTRLPMYRDQIDNVVGVLHLRRLANLSNEKSLSKRTLERLADEPYFVPESTPLSTQLVQFQRSRQRFALVVDEYGDIQGLVTLEDILVEPIVSSLQEMTASDDEGITREAGDRYLVAGTTNIREMNRMLNWELPTDGPKTLNGLIIEYLERIPTPGTCLKIDGYPMEIIESDESRVQTARIFAPEIAAEPRRL